MRDCHHYIRNTIKNNLTKFKLMVLTCSRSHTFIHINKRWNKKDFTTNNDVCTYLLHLPSYNIPNTQYRCQSVLLNWQNSHNHHHTATTATTLSSLYGKYLIEHYTNRVLGAMQVRCVHVPIYQPLYLCRHIVYILLRYIRNTANLAHSETNICMQIIVNRAELSSVWAHIIIIITIFWFNHFDPIFL